MQFSFAFSEGACFYDIWSKDILSIRRLLECDIQSIRCFISFDVQSTASYCLKLVQKIDRHEKNSYVFQILFLKKFLNSLNANVLDSKIHRFKIVCTTKKRIDQIIFDKMLCILHVESTRSALERHFLGVPTAWIFTETPLIKFDMIFDV